MWNNGSWIIRVYPAGLEGSNFFYVNKKDNDCYGYSNSPYVFLDFNKALEIFNAYKSQCPEMGYEILALIPNERYAGESRK